MNEFFFKNDKRPFEHKNIQEDDPKWKQLKEDQIKKMTILVD